jgi:hypothetical protein
MTHGVDRSRQRNLFRVVLLPVAVRLSRLHPVHHPPPVTSPIFLNGGWRRQALSSCTRQAGSPSSGSFGSPGVLGEALSLGGCQWESIIVAEFFMPHFRNSSCDLSSPPRIRLSLDQYDFLWLSLCGKTLRAPLIYFRACFEHYRDQSLRCFKHANTRAVSSRRVRL